MGAGVRGRDGHRAVRHHRRGVHLKTIQTGAAGLDVDAATGRWVGGMVARNQLGQRHVYATGAHAGDVDVARSALNDAAGFERHPPVACGILAIDGDVASSADRGRVGGPNAVMCGATSTCHRHIACGADRRCAVQTNTVVGTQ